MAQCLEPEIKDQPPPVHGFRLDRIRPKMAESYYSEKPSTSAAGIFTIAFGIITLTTIVQLIVVARKGKDRRVWILVPFIAGGICETLGYISRICSIKSPELQAPWIAQNLLILVAPALFTITYHLTINRVFSVLGARQFSPIPLEWLAKLFVVLDLLCFFLQGAGSGLLSRDSASQQQTGRNIVVGGCALQLVVSVLFLAVIVIFERRIAAQPTKQALEYRHLPSKYRNWKMILTTLTFSSSLVMLRCLVLCIKYARSSSSRLSTKEVYLYIFDATFMCVSMLLFTLQHLAGFFWFIKFEAPKAQDVPLESVDNYSDGKLT